MAISKSLYPLVQQRGEFRCEYCHYPEILSISPLSIDHLQPQSFGGTDNVDNLALACRRCNERRYITSPPESIPKLKLKHPYSIYANTIGLIISFGPSMQLRSLEPPRSDEQPATE